MIPSGYLQDLTARVDLVELISRHVTLRRAGANYLGLCPFHGEKSPSFTVSAAKQFYHCFGCGAHGDAIRFLCEHSGFGFVDAVRELSQQVGMTVPETEETPAQKAEAQRRRAQQQTLTEVLGRAAHHFRSQLKASPRAIQYLKGRGLTGEVAAQFGLGYAPDSWKGLASAFPEYDDPQLEAAGLVIVQGEDEGASRRYDRFRDRVMFPIRSVQGEVIGFGGRVLDRGEPKYLNSPETPVFSKGRELYGLFEARQAIRQAGYALVVEGYMDVVALAQSGFGQAVATLGTACTADHVQKLFRFTDAIVFSFDGDAAGRRAAQRALEASLPFATDTRTVRFLFLPAAHDPDSFVRSEGAKAFEAAIRAAVPLSVQIVEAARDAQTLDTAEARAQMLARARPWVAALPDGVLRQQIVQQLASQAQVDAVELERQCRPAPAARPAAGSEPPPQAPAGAASTRSRSARAPDGGSQRGTPRAPRKPLQTLATPLDRAAAIVLRRAETWARLGPDDHELLTGQPAPHGVLFAWVDRMLAEHGPTQASDLVELAAADEDRSTLLPLVERCAAFLDWDRPEDDADELPRIVERLRLQALEVELDLLLGTPGLSAEAMQHGRVLMQRRAELKNALGAALPPPATR